MKILLVNTYHFRGGGDSTYTFNLADLLRNKGHEVAFFAMQDDRNLPDPNEDLFVSYIDFKEKNKNKNIVNGIRVISRIIYSTEARNKFKQLLERFSPDIIHLQNLHAHITPSIIFEAKKHNIPVVWTLHDYKIICPNSHFLLDGTGQICEACGKAAYYKPLLAKCKKSSFLASSMAALEAVSHRLMRVRDKVDLFLAPSVFLRNKFLERGFSPQKVLHLPYTLSDQMFYKNGTDQDYILFLGKLEPLKGIYTLIEACKLVPHIKLVMAGRVEEPLKSKLPQLLPPNAQYVGIKHGEELRQLLMNSRALVLPSLWYENQPFCIIEAFAAGKPAIASDIGGMTELINREERGLLVPPGDISALADAMERFSRQPGEAKKMGEAAYEYALKVHFPAIHYKNLMNMYKEILH
jgi:glycosyltransferase involved in cell wall biosynthesis